MKTKIKRPSLDELRERLKVLPPRPETDIEPVEMIKCPHCSKLWEGDFDASACCQDENEPYFVCPICTKNARRLGEDDKGVFGDEDDCLRHIQKEHPAIKTIDGEYLDLIREGLNWEQIQQVEARANISEEYLEVLEIVGLAR